MDEDYLATTYQRIYLNSIQKKNNKKVWDHAMKVDK